MKKLILLALLISTGIKAQEKDNVYLGFTFDPNSALAIVDNPRMEKDIKGLDFDIELGARFRTTGIYIFYGGFFKQDYQNYGLGYDYYLSLNEKIDVSIGVGYGVLMRKLEGDDDFLTFQAWHGRGQFKYEVLPNLTAVARLQYQQRGDIKVYGIIEGSLGFEFSIDMSNQKYKR